MKVKRNGLGGHWRKRKDFSFARYFSQPVFSPNILPNVIPVLVKHLVWDSARHGTYRRENHGEIGSRRRNLS